MNVVENECTFLDMTMKKCVARPQKYTVINLITTLDVLYYGVVYVK